MPEYRLDGLSSRTFEHLIQSLTQDSISDTATPFGDGPDGGREATFDGQTKYGPESDPWNGYGVVQAKFLQRPKGSRSDGQWALRELKKELKKFTRVRRPLKVPEYYIFATNVVLSPTEDRGYKDQILATLAKFKSETELVAFDVWDYDKIRTLLDNNDSVRKAYSAWITVGDVLYQLSEFMNEQRPDYHKLVVNYLQKELLVDQYAKLEQAGHTADEAIPLAQVFVDLPIAQGSTVERFKYEGQNTASLPLFIDYIIASSAEPLGLQALDSDVDARRTSARPGRYMLVGGPGQGKTTLGQFACQIFRTALLADVPSNLLGPGVESIIDSFSDSFRRGTTPYPAARRLPFRVVLSDFAAALADESVTGLQSYLANIFRSRTNSDLTQHQFEQLLVDYPSFLVLDGLDEVPASSNRDQVLSAVRDFSVDVATGGIDMLIMSTTRPQGYNEDFSPKIYDHRWLVPLPKARAIEYGTRLATVRFQGDTERIDKIVRRLQLASEAVATARIMLSPLQVTILTLLVDRRGQLPQERWALFDEYYTLIYQRETERDIPAAAILRENKDDIDAVHRIVGLLLQVESEHSGRTDAKLTTDQFASVVHEYLRSEGHVDDDLNDLKTAIIEGAANRLVFLVGLESGEVGFEIRSLQEFMAAEGLLDADDQRVQNRLRAIAGNSNWRNVMLFAAGKIFSERRYLRDTIQAICLEINEDLDDAAARLVFAGSELALDLLEDGPVARQPEKSRSLTRLALRLLELDSTSWSDRLSSLAQAGTLDIYLEVLHDKLSSRVPHIARNAWTCLVVVGIRYEAVRSILSEVIREGTAKPDAAALVQIGRSLSSSADDWLISLFENVLPTCKPSELQDAGLRGHLLQSSDEIDRIFENSGWLAAIWNDLTSRFTYPADTSIRIFQGDSRRAIGRIHLETGTSQEVSQRRCVAYSNFPFEYADPEWRLAEGVAVFDDAPSSDALVKFLKLAAASPIVEGVRGFYPRSARWVLRGCYFEGLNTGDFDPIIGAAAAGVLGDRADWEAWEIDWRSSGVDVAHPPVDLKHRIESASVGPWLPLRTSAVQFSRAGFLDFASVQDAIIGNKWPIHSLVGSGMRYRTGSRLSPVSRPLSPALQAKVLELAASPFWIDACELIQALSFTPPLTDEWIEAFSKGGESSEHLIPTIEPVMNFSAWFVEAFERRPDCSGLLVCLASCERLKLTSRQRLLLSDIKLTECSLTVRAARIIIMFRVGTPISELHDEIEYIIRASPRLGNFVLSTVFDEHHDVVSLIPDLLAIQNRVRALPSSDGSVRQAIRNCVRARRSELSSEGRWRELGFLLEYRSVVRRD